MNGVQSLVQSQAARVQGRFSFIGPRPAHRSTVAPHHLGFLVITSGHRSLQGSNAAHTLFELLLGVPVGFPGRTGRLLEIMVLAQLMRHPWKNLGDRLADALAV
jgi:hypothetical protein